MASTIRVGDRIYPRNPEVNRFQIPLNELGNLRMVDIPAHSHLEVLGLRVPVSGVDCEMWLVNGGDDGSDEYLAVYGGASIPVAPETAQHAVARLRRAFPDRLVPGASRHPQISVEDFAGRGLIADVFLNLEFKGKGETSVHDAIGPFVWGFRRLSLPDARAFICHASEDKPVVRRLAEFIEQQGVGVWLDEREINVGDSIVQKVSEALENVSHLIVVLSAHSVGKPWVTRELSAALMRQLAQREITVLPLRLDNAPLPVLLSDIMYADGRSSLESGFKELVDAMLLTGDA
jgi:hypothetical protein